MCVVSGDKAGFADMQTSLPRPMVYNVIWFGRVGVLDGWQAAWTCMSGVGQPDPFCDTDCSGSGRH